MAITAALVKELRERTGAGMMECKKILTETNGDIESAIEELRKRGAAQADKKASRIAAEGTVVAVVDGSVGVVVEVNCETDFVAKDENFVAFANNVAATIVAGNPADVEALNSLALAGGTASVEETRSALVQKIGEKVDVRRFERIAAADGETVGAYQHGKNIGVLVHSTADTEMGRDIAMHVAASKPMCVSADQVSAETIAKEKEIYLAQAADSGKPAEIMEKMVEGKLRKFVNEVTLLGQAFVKNPDQTVEKLLKTADAQVKQFVRYEVGEGIEKKEDNFVEEVMAAVKS
ncbi:MAG: translation elongation factor Ts [Arenicella sp.]